MIEALDGTILNFTVCNQFPELCLTLSDPTLIERYLELPNRRP